jgi:hypothetical protein
VMIGEVDVILSIPGSEPVEALPNFVGGLSGARPTVISPNAFVLRKPHEHGLALANLRRLTGPIFDNVAKTQIIGAMEQILRRRGRLKPRKPLALV